MTSPVPECRPLADGEGERWRNEELANSISHGVALVAAFIAIPFLIMHAARNGDAAFLVGTCVFSATIVFLYLFSTIYHVLPIGKAKGLFRIIDHCAIFLLIAGTYTPFTLGLLRGTLGWTLFGVIWGLAVAGVLLKVFLKTFHPILSTGLYLIMGWVVIIAAEPVFGRLSTGGLLWLIAGGLSYTAGVYFFVNSSRLQYGHLIWHLFVMAGTACHYFAVFWYAV
jgi:hemolysin III